MIRTLCIASIALSIPGYAGSPEAEQRLAPQTSLAASCTGPDCPGFQQSMELIGTGTCDLILNRLRNCQTPDGTIFPPAIDSAVPLRTVIRPVKSGACSTSYSLQLKVTSPQLQEVHQFRYIEGQVLALRAPTGAPIEELALTDGSQWTGIASFAMPCTITAALVINEPDVDSAAEAQALLDSIQARLDDAIAERDAYEQLLLFVGAYDFLRAVADNLYGELTNDMMQALRAEYVAAMPAFNALAASDVCTTDLGADAGALLSLAGSLFALGDASDWQNPDGTTKTLADLYTEFRGDGVVAQIEALAESADPALEQQYLDAFDAAAVKVAELEADLALARVQLDYWL